MRTLGFCDKTKRLWIISCNVHFRLHYQIQELFAAKENTFSSSQHRKGSRFLLLKSYYRTQPFFARNVKKCARSA
jgi:hypothetical protein